MTRKYYTYRIRITSLDRVQAEIRDADNTVLGEPSGTLTYSEAVQTRIQAFQQKAAQGILLDAEVEQFGEALFATLFDEGLRYDFFTRYQTARAEKALLRIELDVDEDQLPEVAALPWEFLRVPADAGYGTVWFGTAPDLIFSRRRALWTAAAPIQLKEQESLRIALAVAAPENLGPVEYKELLASLKALAHTTRIELLEPVTPANRSAIDEILRQEPHIFHFIGHAKFSDDQEQQEGQIALTNPDGKMKLISADDFSELFTRHQPGVVVLQSCESGVLSASKAFVGIASQIVQQNIPVVVAMQYQVSNATATLFALEFYKRLAENDPVDLAVQEGRRQIALGPAGYNQRDFATPNLFMRVRDGHLFQLPSREENVSAGQKTPEQDKTVVVVSGEGRRWACLIGTNKYDDPDLPPLTYPEENVDALARLLEDKYIGDFDQVVVLKGKTHLDVIRGIKNLSEQLKVSDMLLIYCAGYVFLEEETGKLYLVTKGTAPDFLAQSAVEIGVIKTRLDQCKAIQKILILDCQYGGQCPPYQLDNAETVRVELSAKTQGKYLISSPLTPVEPSPPDDEVHSPLTKYLIEGLNTGKADLDKSGKVTVAEWYTYLERQMIDRGLPQPLKWNEGLDGNWIIARSAEDSEEAAKVLPASLRRNYKYIGEMFRDGMVIPFLGSGIVMESLPPVAADADNDVFTETPLEHDLAQRMAEQAEFLEEAQHNPLTVISQHYQTNVIGARALFYRQLKKLFPQDVRPGPIHRFLVQQEKPMLVLTACYDTLLEELFREQGKKFVVVTHIAYAEDEGNLGKVVVQYSDQPEEVEIGLSDELSIDLEKWWVFYKIQGSFDLFTKGLGGKEELDSIVISEEDYVTFLSRLSDQHRTIPTLFSRLFQQRMFLFLGYRMTDWNFRTVVHVLRKEEKIRKIKGYAVRHGAAEFERQYWDSKNVQIIDMPVSEFVKDLAGEMGISVQ